MTSTDRPAAPRMVNGIKTAMVNERLILGTERSAGTGRSGESLGFPLTQDEWEVSPIAGDYTHPLSSRIASCQIISMPASLSLRQGMATKFWPP